MAVEIGRPMPAHRRLRVAVAVALAAVMAAILIPIGFYLMPPPQHLVQLPATEVLNLDGPAVIVSRSGTADVVLQPGQRTLAPSAISIVNGPPYLNVVGQDTSKSFLRTRLDNQNGPINIVVRWPGFAYRE